MEASSLWVAWMQLTSFSRTSTTSSRVSTNSTQIDAACKTFAYSNNLQLEMKQVFKKAWWWLASTWIVLLTRASSETARFITSIATIPGKWDLSLRWVRSSLRIPRVSTLCTPTNQTYKLSRPSPGAKSATEPLTSMAAPSISEPKRIWSMAK